MPEIFDLDLDEELLSHLSDPDSWVALRGEGFAPELINDEDVLEVYQWADKHVRRDGVPPSPSVLAEEWDVELTDPETAIGDLIEKLRDRYRENTMRDQIKEIAEQYKKDSSQVPKMLTRAGKQLTELLVPHGEVYGTGDYSRAARRYVEHENDGPGPSLGFPEIDAHLHGQKGISVYVGPPKTWKSWCMVKGVLENVHLGGYPWLYSLELPAEETWWRALCMYTDTPWWRYVNKRLEKSELAIIEEAAQYMDGEGAFKVNKPPEGERSIDQLVGRAQDAGASVVFIDQLQYVEVDGRSLGEWNDTGKYWAVMNRARNLSDEIPICFAHQFNRSTMNNEKMPDVKQAKGSSAIEEAATLVLGIWANKEMRRSRRLEIGTLAVRNHDFCTWELAIDLSEQCDLKVLREVEDEDE